MTLLSVVRDTVPVGEGGGPLGVSATVFVPVGTVDADRITRRLHLNQWYRFAPKRS